MAVSIRLTRVGRSNAPVFRVVATDSRNKRDGRYIENLGTYNPITHKFAAFHPEKIQEWISKGAIPSDSVKKLMKQYKAEKVA